VNDDRYLIRTPKTVEQQIARRLEEAMFGQDVEAKVSALRKSVGIDDGYGRIVGLLGVLP